MFKYSPNTSVTLKPPLSGEEIENLKKNDYFSLHLEDGSVENFTKEALGDLFSGNDKKTLKRTTLYKKYLGGKTDLPKASQLVIELFLDAISDSYENLRDKVINIANFCLEATDVINSAPEEVDKKEVDEPGTAQQPVGDEGTRAEAGTHETIASAAAMAALRASFEEFNPGDVDDDKNGFLQVDELDLCFREHFAPELQGKSLVYFFRRWSTDHDKDMVNYRLIKEAILEKMDLQQVDYSPEKSMNTRFMQRSGTQNNLHSELKAKMGLGDRLQN